MLHLKQLAVRKYRDFLAALLPYRIKEKFNHSE